MIIMIEWWTMIGLFLTIQCLNYDLEWLNDRLWLGYLSTITTIYCIISHHGVALSKKITVAHIITKIIVKTMIIMIEWWTMIGLFLTIQCLNYDLEWLNDRLWLGYLSTITTIYCIISHHGVALSKKITVPHIITKIIVKTMIRMIEW